MRRDFIRVTNKLYISLEPASSARTISGSIVEIKGAAITNWNNTPTLNKASH